MSDREHDAAFLRARILAEVQRTPAPTRDAHRRRVLLSTGVGALVTALLFAALGGVQAGTRPAALVVFTAGSALLAAVLLTRVTAGARGSVLGPPGPRLVATIAIAAPVLALAVLAMTRLWPEHIDAAHAVRTDLACGSLSLFQGLVPLLVLVLPRRGSDPVHPVITGAALGVTAGAWSVALAYLRCPHTEPLHCLLAHVVPTLALAALGALLGALVLRQRTS